MTSTTNTPTLFFDLDGTIIDSASGITHSMQRALAAHGIEVPDRNTLLSFIGPPLLDSLDKFYGIRGEKATAIVESYRHFYANEGVYDNTLYPNIDDLLRRLHRAGVPLVLATSKPTEYAQKTLVQHALTDCFLSICGSTLDHSRSKKADVIAYALSLLPTQQKERVIMIGDRHHDVDGAMHHHLPCIGVLYGYGNREELERADAWKIAATVAELDTLLFSLL